MSIDASPGIDPRNRPPTRPPLIRSRSDTNPPLTYPSPPQRLQKDATPSLSTFIDHHSSKPDVNGQGTSVVYPNRPPRNPARVAQERLIVVQSPTPILSAKKSTVKSYRPRTATGTREEVTPWELHPPPDSYGRDSSKSKVVGVTGDIVVEQTSKRAVRSSSSARPGTSFGNSTGINFPDISILRRKSTGSKLQKNRPPSGHASPHTLRPLPTIAGNPPLRQQPSQIIRSPKSPHATPRATQKAPERAVLSEPESFLERQIIPEGPSLSHSSSSATTSSDFGPRKSTSISSSEIHKTNLKFSTADRTILEELKRNIQARAAQFVTKGGGPASHNVTELGVASTFSMGRVGGIGSARKHHPYRKEEAPYPRSYEREVLDLDVWENLFCKQICGSLTWHEFEQPPTKVLDIGCGTGSWILDCAIVWRHCHFVGLDIVPLHPDLKQVGSNDLAQRITWIQDNFLDGLPFPNEEFDFVHIKRIARGVPEDKWDFLFEEITRVMKPSGAFEMIEEDLFFPGYRDNSNDEDEDGANNSWSQDSRRPILRRASIGTNRGSFPSAIQRSSGLMAPSGSDISDIDYDLDSESAFTSSAGSGSLHRLSNELSTPSLKSAISPVVGSTIGTLASPQTKAMTPITSLGREVGAIVEDEEGELRAGSGMGTPPEDIQRHDRFGTNSTVRPDTVTVCSPKGNPNLNGQSMSVQSGESSLNNGSGPPNSTNNQSSVAPFLLRSSLSSSNSRASLDSQPHFPLLQHRVAASIPHHRSAIFSNVNPNEQLSQQVSEGTTIAPISPFVLRQLPKPPVNPRDHSLLEMIYNEMHSSRFINLSPLSILPNTLGLYFKDVRTHPPLQFKFPPRAVPLGSGLRTADQAHDSYHPEYDENEGRDAIPTLPMVTEPRARRHSSAAPSQKHFFVSNPPNGGLDGREDGCDEDNFLTVRSLIRGTSPYISLDDSPPAAFSPSARASFLRSPLKQRIEFPLSDSERAGRASPDSLEAVNATPFSVAASVSMLRSRLPNKRLNVDLRSLNLHLCARVAEVLACTETMWEWVQEYQEKIRVEKATRTQRARSKSVDVHPRFITPAPETTSDRLMAAVGRLAREEFEDLLLRFYLDMQDHVGIDHAIQKRFGWSTLRTSPTAERKSFDDACKRYALWEQDQQARRVDRPHASSRTWTRPLSASYTSNFSPLDSLTSPPEAVFQLEPATSEGGASNLTPRPSADTSRGRPRRERSSSYSAPRSQTPHVSSEPNRLSRAMRVFVAWKSD